MAEDEINYATVVIQSKKESQLEAATDKTVYDEVKIQNTLQQTGAKDPVRILMEKETKGKCWNYQLLASGFGTFCVFFILSIVICVHFSALYEGEKTKQTCLLEKYIYLESKHNNLTGLYENLTEQIQNMKNNLNELNVSRAQWSIDAYCPKSNNERTCKACQVGWMSYQYSCYAYNDAQPPDWRTWAGARDNCSGKLSDLTVVADEQEKNYILNYLSPSETGITGYWIGLRAVNGTWKWIDGTNLTNQLWVNQPAADGQCVTSLKGSGWRSASCNTTNAWICEKKALSV